MLTEVELFELTSFCTRINEMLPFNQRLLEFGSPDGILFEGMDEPLQILNPDRKGSIGFYIEDARTPALLEARTNKRTAERQLRTKDERSQQEKNNLMKLDADAEPRSLTSPRNRNVTSVSVLIRTAEIKKKKAETHLQSADDRDHRPVSARVGQMFSDFWNFLTGWTRK